MADAHLLAVTSDVHAGSSVGLCPPDPIALDDGGSYVPSAAQRWLWDAWGRFWSEVAKVREAESAELTWLQNGDAVEGDHHHSPQMPSTLSITHGGIFRECAAVPLALKPDRIIGVRGTEAHVGRSGQTEEGIFKGLRGEGYPVEMDGHRHTWWIFTATFGGVLVNATHHGRMGRRAHTRSSYIRLYAEDVWSEHARWGDRAPDLAIRSHYHKYGDSGRAHDIPTRVVATPCFQLATAFGIKIAADSLPDIGGVIVLIRNGEVDVRPVLSKPSREPAREIA